MSWRKQSREPLVLDVQEGLASLPKVQLPISEATREAAVGSNRTKRSINHKGATSLAGLFSATASDGLEADPWALVAPDGVKGGDRLCQATTSMSPR